MKLLVILFIYGIVETLMMLPKLATPGLLKIKTFSNKDYDVMISVHDVTNKISSRDSNQIVNGVM